MWRRMESVLNLQIGTHHTASKLIKSDAMMNHYEDLSLWSLTVSVLTWTSYPSSKKSLWVLIV